MPGKAPSKEAQEARRSSPDRALVRERIAAIGQAEVARLVAADWDVKNPRDASTMISKYLSGERTINATAYVQLLSVLGFEVANPSPERN